MKYDDKNHNEISIKILLNLIKTKCFFIANVFNYKDCGDGLFLMKIHSVYCGRNVNRFKFIGYRLFYEDDKFIFSNHNYKICDIIEVDLNNFNEILLVDNEIICSLLGELYNGK